MHIVLELESLIVQYKLLPFIHCSLKDCEYVKDPFDRYFNDAHQLIARRRIEVDPFLLAHDTIMCTFFLLALNFKVS